MHPIDKTHLDQLAHFIADGYYDNARELIETWTGGPSARLDELKGELIKRRPFIFLPNRFEHLGFDFYRSGGNSVCLRKQYGHVTVQLADDTGATVPRESDYAVLITVWHGALLIGQHEVPKASAENFICDLDVLFSDK